MNIWIRMYHTKNSGTLPNAFTTEQDAKADIASEFCEMLEEDDYMERYLGLDEQTVKRVRIMIQEFNAGGPPEPIIDFWRSQHPEESIEFVEVPLHE